MANELHDKVVKRISEIINSHAGSPGFSKLEDLPKWDAIKLIRFLVANEEYRKSDGKCKHCWHIHGWELLLATSFDIKVHINREHCCWCGISREVIINNPMISASNNHGPKVAWRRTFNIEA